ncbi:MAG: dTDP-4-dehydrorhamnose 3,5-epimerase [Candidatus Wallbacteria bacterium]|nr:dTDP-4-dehydrorhamnose 3,5-epimerase [Candidatus Wallbacteria bacterium]
MKFTGIGLEGAHLIEPEPISDNRGWFARVFCRNEFKEIGFQKEIVQMNHTYTKMASAIRGLHYQIPPSSEMKLVRCIRGAVYDVIVDLRAGSDTFLHFAGVELSAENRLMLIVPEYFAHGFQTLTDDCEMLYCHTGFYSREHERGLRFDDPILGIRWPLEISEISERDRNFELLKPDYRGIK